LYYSILKKDNLKNHNQQRIRESKETVGSENLKESMTKKSSKQMNPQILSVNESISRNFWVIFLIFLNVKFL